MRVLVDTGIFSASLSRRKRDQHLRHLTDLVGHQLFLAAQTVAELRFGALVAGWGESRRHRLAHAVSLTTVVPVTDRLITEVAHLRWECRLAGHPLASEAHTGDCGSPPPPVSSRPRSRPPTGSSSGHPA